MKEFSRLDRIGDQMQRELAVMIQREVKDPRLDAMITVSGVKVSKDLGYADVYVTILGKEDKPEVIAENMAILKQAAGFLRSRIGQAIKLRVVPQLRFHFDESVRRGQELSSLIERAMAEDRSRHREDGKD
ncbi:30S ribosome-binding factor RbfA [Marinospirillum alkaliphilum]|uniref:Ribosome-binding factor A n=1 Tax=Marinospirillum alkaliphilum DSM 21637 TaxID=1122209 RepID=A0A1K1Y5W0_9GAMM|nr:30S ribosome-binding factor RbfA [Marinospirillum alkaliphilum]SFX57126.1 ribosome-binding factor A [Marinospirillum alkaliphilum DSM 21637]